MRNIISKLSGIFVPVLLCASLIVTAVMSLDLIDDLQGNARVINHIGIVRGATQRLIKKEMNHKPDDALIERLDAILQGLSEGSKELNLIKLEDEEFQTRLARMQEDWEYIKTEIYAYRNGADTQALYELSEEYFELSDDTVFTAEEATEQAVQSARNFLIVMNSIFVFMAIGCSIFTLYQERRHKALIAAENKNIEKSKQLARRAQELLAPMNEISELMYVSDLNTYELLFVNDAGKKIFRIDNLVPNMKCYKVIQGLDQPCPFCTNKMLKADETYSWEHTNPIIKRHYLLKDRLTEWEGHPAKIEIAFDITEANNEKNELKKRLKRDDIRLQCVREMYNNRDINVALNNVLEYIGRLFDAERAYIFIIHDNYFSNLAEWCKEGISPEIDSLQDIPMKEYQSWFDSMQTEKKVVINDINELKETMPAGYDLLDRQGIRNIVWVPLLKDGKINGVLGLDNQDLELAELAAPFLQTVQYFLSLTMQRDENEKMLLELSQVDKLTTFYNRNRFMQDVEECKETNTMIGVVYLDINGLKDINDSLGHAAGDQQIKECAHIIKKGSASNYLYRIGGDEFVILYKDMEEEAFFDEIQQLKNKFQKSQCQIAIGCKWDKNSGRIQEIIKEADERMYNDKKKFYQGHCATTRYRHNNDVLSYLANPEILKEKIRSGNFEVYLQSKFDVEHATIIGAEALVRYVDENGNIITPDKFIPILEDTYYICKIDYYVFEVVCKKLSEWNHERSTAFTISSNFSRVTFMDDNFVKRIEAISDKYEVERNHLEIEITESANSTDLNTLVKRIQEIRSAGFRVAMDDFGVERSNLALLSLVKLDVLKLDKGFIKDIANNERAQTIIQMMVRMCNDMEIQIIAEGIENKEQLEILQKYGIKIVQGFLFSMPISFSAYEEKYIK